MYMDAKKIVNITLIAILLIATYLSLNLVSDGKFGLDPGDGESYSDDSPDNPEETDKEKNDQAKDKKKDNKDRRELAAGGEGGDEEQEESASEEDPEPEDNETEIILTGELGIDIIDYEFRIVEDGWAKVTSITYKISNGASYGIYPLVLIYLYDEGDDESIKGLVRDQINMGSLLIPGSSVTRTESIDADIQGNLAEPKILKLSLVNSYKVHSQTLDQDEVEVDFIG